MNIGIDIDNTLTKVQNELNQAAFNYAIKLGKKIDNPSNPMEDIKNNGDTYKKNFQFSYEELKYFLKNIQEEIINNALPRKYVVDAIKNLRNNGNKIYIITARDSEFHDDPYKLSEDWLKRNNIEYDKLIVNAREKAPICKKENIDIFIDDQLNNCLDIEKIGIKTIRISDDIKKYDNIVSFNNWIEIYDYLNNNLIYKILTYNESNKDNKEIHDFVNESMHEFIGRPYKNRDDVLNIKNHYIDKNGEFLIAIDAKSKNIIGTIAIENNKTYGILKRFYISKNYQHNGIGQALYNYLEQYIKDYTNITKIYLACGNTLGRAHKFYEKNGFNQISDLDIDMHYADDDDFFCKNITN